MAGKGAPGDLIGKLLAEIAYIPLKSIRLCLMKYKDTHRLIYLLVVLGQRRCNNIRMVKKRFTK